MKNKFLQLVLFSLLFVAFTVSADTLVFSAIPDEDETRLKKRFDHVAQYLSKELGVPVNFVPVKSYAATVTAFRNNQIQLAWFGGLSGVRARLLVPGSEAIAQGEEDREFKTYFIAHASTGLKKSHKFPDGIAGKNFTFGSKGSTSGRLMPEYFIREHFKQAPEKVFARVGFSGDHSRTLALVQSGAYEVGALNYTVWQNDIQAGNIDPSRVSIIWETPVYPDYQWTIRGDVDKVWGKGFKERVKRALLDLKDPDVLAAFPRKRFIPASNDEYQPILDTARQIGILDE